MHEFRRFIQDQMNARGWKAADLARHSSLSAQHVSRLLNDDRDQLGRMPESTTIKKLASAFQGVGESAVRAAAAKALGVPDVPQISADLTSVDDDALLAEVRRRMNRELNASPHAGISGTAPLPETQDSLDLAASKGDPSQGAQQRQRDAQDEIEPDPDGPEWGA